MTSRARPTIQPNGPLLGPVEDLFCGIEDERTGAFRAAAMVRVAGCVEPDHLATALRSVQHRHPKLRAGIVRGADGRRRYDFSPPVPPIPFEVKEYDGPESPWRGEVRQLLEVALPSGGPLAVVTVLRNRSRRESELLIAVHHAIADGLSALMLIDDVLTGYAEAETHVRAAAAARPVRVPRHAAGTGRWSDRLWLVRRFLRLTRSERRSPQTRLPECDGVEPQSQWVHWVFTADETVRLVRRCRKERVALGSALVAAVCRGLTDALPAVEGFFKCQSPFDIRDHLRDPHGPVSREDLGCFVGIMNGFYPAAGQVSIWDVARQVNDDVQAYAQHGGPSFSYNLTASALTRFLARTALVASTHQRVTLLATNYGVASIREAYGSLRPTACTLMFKNDCVGPSLVMEALVLGQRLNIGFAADRLMPAFWERLHAAVRGHLDAACGVPGRTAAEPVVAAGSAT